MDACHQDLTVDVDYLMERLQPLREGKSVALQILTPHASGRRKNPLMTLTPGVQFGFPKSTIVIALIDNGSCIIDLDTKGKKRTDPRPLPKVTPLVMAGLSAKLAVTLVTKLQALMGYSKEKYNGNRTTHDRSTRTKRPRRPRCTPYRDSSTRS